MDSIHDRIQALSEIDFPKLRACAKPCRLISSTIIASYELAN